MMRLQNPMRSRGSRRTIIVGFDFGTHSTKVAVRERGKADGRIAQFDDGAPGYPAGSSPSLIRCLGDRLYFGTEALRRRGGHAFASLKVGLLTGRDTSGNGPPGESDIAVLVAAYFSWAFQRLRDSLTDYLDANWFINVAAPMSHYETPLLKEKYLQIIHAAWSLAFDEQHSPIGDGVHCGDARSILAPKLKQAVPGPETRKFEVLPETIAPVVSLSLDPWMQPGMYLIVDTGAGTTEMSVFHAGEAGADQRVLCYQDETMLLGGNDFQLAEQHEDPVETDRLICQLEKWYRKIWHAGYRLDAPNHCARKRWKELTLVLSGGGTRHLGLTERLAAINPMSPWSPADTRLRVCRHVPGTLDLDSNIDEHDGSMYAVANGLAIERRHWPVVFQPAQVEPLAPTEEIADKPQAYWYIEGR